MTQMFVFGEPLSYFLFEMMVLALFLCCLYFGFRRTNIARVAFALELLCFTIYGLCFESMAVASGFYEYAPFTFRIWKSPLVIGMGWAVIGVSVMWFSDKLNTTEWSRPFLDAGLALLIDLGMDAVAIRDRYVFASGEDSKLLGMWNWGLPYQGSWAEMQWFGVPFGNFVAWWAIIFIMSAMLRLGRYTKRWFGKDYLNWVYPIAALFVALTIFLALLLGFTHMFSDSTILVLLTVSLLVTAVNVRGVSYNLSWQNDAPVFIVPLAFHLFFLVLMLWRNLYADVPVILVISIVVFAINEFILQFSRRKSPKY